MTDGFSSLHFDTIFEVLVAFEAFTAWRARSFVGDPASKLGDRPSWNKEKFTDVGIEKPGDLLKFGFEMIGSWIEYIFKCVWFYICKACWFCWVKFCRNFHNIVGGVLKFSPIISIPLYASSYLWGFNNFLALASF